MSRYFLFYKLFFRYFQISQLVHFIYLFFINWLKLKKKKKHQPRNIKSLCRNLLLKVLQVKCKSKQKKIIKEEKKDLSLMVIGTMVMTSWPSSYFFCRVLCNKSIEFRVPSFLSNVCDLFLLETWKNFKKFQKKL